MTQTLKEKGTVEANFLSGVGSSDGHAIRGGVYGVIVIGWRHGKRELEPDKKGLRCPYYIDDPAPYWPGRLMWRTETRDTLSRHRNI